MKHLVQPKDMAIMAEMATGICTGVGRSIKFFHMPVPIDRTEDAPEEGRERGGFELSVPDRETVKP